MNGVLPRATIGRPALRAALVSIEISTLTFFWKMSASNAFCAPAAPEPSSATSSASGWPSTPPLALISSTASSADCTTDGATTELAPERPTGTPILMGSAAITGVMAGAHAAAAAKNGQKKREHLENPPSVFLCPKERGGYVKPSSHVCLFFIQVLF